jgi:hypothetical protein
MKFTGKSVQSLTKILKTVGKAKKVRFTVPLDGVAKGTLKDLGFDENPSLGDYLTPSAIGKYTNYNANGDVKVRRDLPKESESVMFYGASRDWQGGIHYGIKTRTMDKYTREYIPAPSEILEIIDIDGKSYISSSELNLIDSDEKRNIHITNVMLECFSEFEIFDIEKSQIIGPKLKRLQWDVLPSGEYPWEKSKPIIQKATESLDEKEKEVIEHRMRVISRRNPDFLATGRAGFSGYFVYGFKGKDVYVLESIHLDNATYIFNSNWEALSQLTKSEIINGAVPHKRIIHNGKWSVEVGRAIEQN